VASPPKAYLAADNGLLLLTTKDVARLCQVNRHAAGELIHQAGAVRIGSSLRVRRSDLEGLLERLARRDQ
jgi:hypothetical protein